MARESVLGSGFARWNHCEDFVPLGEQHLLANIAASRSQNGPMMLLSRHQNG